MSSTRLKTLLLRSFFISIYILASSSRSWAEVNPDLAFKGIVKGKIESKSARIPVEYANVVIYSLPDSAMVTGTITSSDGSFSISDLKIGSYYLVANFIGFRKKIYDGIIITPENRVVDCGVIFMEESSTELQTVEISSEKNPVVYQIDKKVVNVAKKMDAAGGSVANALENTPSIQVDMEGNVSLRGSSNFTVLIDGKPTSLSGSDALKQIPASMVENVEIITNPSAKYDPDGTSGIINVIMKKNTTKSSNGIVNLSASTYNKYSGDFNFNYFSKKVNFFVNGNYTNSKSLPFSTMDAYKTYNDTTYHTTQEISRNQNFDPYSIGAGFDWTIDSNNSFSVKYDFGHWGMFLNMDAKTVETNNKTVATSYINALSILETSGMYHVGSLTYDHNFDKKGHEMVGSFSVNTWDGGNYTNVDERLTDSEFLNPTYIDHHISDQSVRNVNLELKLDYMKPISDKSKFEAGYEGSYLDQKTNYWIKFKDFATQGWVSPTTGFTDMNFIQNIQALYVTYSGELKGFQYLAGLRGEYMKRNLEFPEPYLAFPLTQYSLFPTFHLTKQMKKGKQLQFSYSRRVNRPREWVLNPFPVYSDSYVSQLGNPYLKPEFTDSYELNLLQRMKMGFVSVEGFFRQTNDAFNRTLTLDTTGILLISTTNMDKSFAYGAEVAANLNPTLWLNIYASANLYSLNIQGDEVTTIGRVSSINSDFALNATFKLKQGIRMQVVGFYNAPQLTSQGRQHEMMGANFSVSKDFFKQKINILLSFRDVFYTQRYGFITETEFVKSTFSYRTEYPVITLRLSYKINDYKRRADKAGETPGFQGGGMM